MNTTTKQNLRGRILACALSVLIVLGLAPTAIHAFAADASKHGTAAVTALKADGTATSMMGAMLDANAELEETEGKIYAVIKFKNATLMNQPVKGTDVSGVKTYEGETEHAAEEITVDAISGDYVIRVFIPDLAADTKLTMVYGGRESTVLLNITNVKWDDNTNKPADGIYSIDAKLYKTDKTNLSMANDSIDHTAKLKVLDGAYYVTLELKSLTVGNESAYLGTLSYYDVGYNYDVSGSPKGTLKTAEVISTQTAADGTAYPHYVRIPLVNLDDAFAPLRVVIPYMEKLAPGMGTHDVLLNLDWSSVKEAEEEDFTPEPTTPVSPALDKTDSSTGVRITAEAGVLPDGVAPVITLIKNGPDFSKTKAALGADFSDFVLYDISLLQGGKLIQPNGKVNVYLPIPAGYDKTKLAVYRINDDGTKTLISGEVEGENYVITVNHFSLYAMALKADASNMVKTGSIPQTGDDINTNLYLLLTLISGALLLFWVLQPKFRKFASTYSTTKQQ